LQHYYINKCLLPGIVFLLVSNFKQANASVDVVDKHRSSPLKE